MNTRFLLSFVFGSLQFPLALLQPNFTALLFI
jgi:hypothetical protein